ncbi:carcinoembryonic antigen-related cell adhesion molecule 1-like isoform X2 [Sardina pilchardus]|uniref:carcinoembryonic antigen-related cell adhesion molecule 1-like isoform X2 n=1 Tax=Sardina pilchardus TaxID=27697 RepID=UPI002E0D8BE6
MLDMEYLLYKTMAFLVLGLCSCQNEILLDGPLNGSVGGSVVFNLTNPPSKPPSKISWISPSNIEIFALLGNTEVMHPDYTGRVSVNKATASLELRSLTLMDTGEYTLSITTDVARQGKTSLTVFENISHPIISINGTPIAGNSSVNLTCDAQGTIVTREWTKDEKPLSPSNSTILHEENRILSIDPVEKEDEGQYTCTLINPFSSVSENYDLVVNYGPLSVHISPAPEVTPGDRVSLDCSADSVPPASFTWMFNKTQIGDKSQLVIEKVDQSHAGMYTCTALNSITALSLSEEQMLRVNDKDSGILNGGLSNGLSDGAIAGIVIGTISMLFCVH